MPLLHLDIGPPPPMHTKAYEEGSAARLLHGCSHTRRVRSSHAGALPCSHDQLCIHETQDDHIVSVTSVRGEGSLVVVKGTECVHGEGGQGEGTPGEDLCF